MGKILGDLGWWEWDKTPLVLSTAWGSCAAKLGLSTRERDKGFLQVLCVHTMAPDPEQCPQLWWHGRTLSPSPRAVPSSGSFFGCAG